MTKPSVQENDSAVKNKKRTRRVVPPGVALTVADIEKLETRYQGPKKNPALYIKRAFQTYIEKCPGLTSTTKRVACFLVDWYRLRDGYARPPISRIAQELVIGKRSAERAVAILHNRGLVFVKSGGPTRRQGFATIASRYVPNFWLVINRDTGAIIGNAKYEFIPLKPIDGAGDYRQNDDRPPYRQNDGTPEPLKPIDGAGDYRQNDGRYVSTEADAHATPTADAPGYATAPLKKESEKTLIGFANVGEMMGPNGFILSGFKFWLQGKRFDDQTERLEVFCQTLQDFPPTNGIKYSQIVIHGGKGTADFIEGHVSLSDLRFEDWLAIEYRIADNSPAV